MSTLHATARAAAVAALLAPTAAHAARHELSFEFGPSIRNDGDADAWFDTFRADALGLRAGGAVLRDRHGFGLVVSGVWSRERDQRTTLDTTNGLVVDRFGAGLKADYDVAGIFFPYVRADAKLASAAARLTSDLDTTELDPIRMHGLGVGGQFTTGFELMVPDETLNLPATVGFYLEVGYLAESNIRLGEMGPINLSGAVVRSGVGLRF
jgi:hypothetical protein